MSFTAIRDMAAHNKEQDEIRKRARTDKKVERTSKSKKKQQKQSDGSLLLSDAFQCD